MWNILARNYKQQRFSAQWQAMMLSRGAILEQHRAELSGLTLPEGGNPIFYSKKKKTKKILLCLPGDTNPMWHTNIFPVDTVNVKEALGWRGEISSWSQEHPAAPPHNCFDDMIQTTENLCTVLFKNTKMQETVMKCLCFFNKTLLIKTPLRQRTLDCSARIIHLEINF